VLQRSPSYYFAGTTNPPLAAELRGLGIDESWVFEIMRRRYLADEDVYLKRSAGEPEAVAAELIANARNCLGPDYDIDTHFKPRYRPWQQRLCLIPDGDFFTSIRSGKVTMVTDEIETFTETGILLKSGKALDADIIVTATGLRLLAFGGIEFEVDGAPVVAPDTVTFHGMMFTGLPNLAWVFGYIRATWTMRVELVADFVCKLLNHLDDDAPPLAPSGKLQSGLRHARPARAPEMWRQAQMAAQPRLLHRQGPAARNSRQRRGAGVCVTVVVKDARMAKDINFIELAKLTPDARRRLMTRTEADLAPYEAQARPIIEAVRGEGDAALARFARQFEHAPVEADAIAATEADFAGAERALDPRVREAMAFAAASIRKFHEDQKPEEMWLHEVRPGAFAGDRATPIPSVACYVPRGKGAFPSVALMTTIPAKVAGVPDICIVTPPGPDGKIDAATLVAARMAGVSRVFKAGGAQGVAAVAYGTATVPRCSKIVGPGSPWVAAAKRLVSHLIDIGSPAGPSELIVLADETADGRLAGLDLLIEAEHGPDSSAFLVTWSRTVAEAARAAIPDYWQTMGAQRVDFSSSVLSGPIGGIVLAPGEEDAIAFVNDYAPEHLQVLSKEPFRYLGRLKNAGEILLGEHTPATLGNFVIGPNHVLPTGGWAKTASALSVFDFMKRTSIAYVTRAGYPELARHAHALATYEGFEAHANAVSETRERLLTGRG
jgi:histidinol dehydrogenase